MSTVFVTDGVGTVDAASSPRYTPGDVAFIDGKEYRYVKCNATTAITIYYPLNFYSNDLDTSEYLVTPDLSAGGGFAGVAMAAAAVGEYIWAMRKGECESVLLAAINTDAHKVPYGAVADGKFTVLTAGDILIHKAGWLIETTTSTTASLGYNTSMYIDAL